MLGSLGLTQSAANSAVAVPTVAVLPFESVGTLPALAEGFSDELLEQLIHNRGLRVIGRAAFADNIEQVKFTVARRHCFDLAISNYPRRVSRPPQTPTKAGAPSPVGPSHVSAAGAT